MGKRAYYKLIFTDDDVVVVVKFETVLQVLELSVLFMSLLATTAVETWLKGPKETKNESLFSSAWTNRNSLLIKIAWSRNRKFQTNRKLFN